MTVQSENKIAFLFAGIRRRRLALGLTQAEVAARAGMKQANYSRMESGRQTPNLETLLSIMDALHLEFRFSNAEETIYHIMYLDQVVADVFVSHDRKSVRFVKYEPDGLRQPFSGGNLNIERFYRFIKSRCYEDSRADIDDILKKAGFTNNNPYDWIALTHGVTYDDFFWIRTNDERITWDEVKIR